MHPITCHKIVVKAISINHNLVKIMSQTTLICTALNDEWAMNEVFIQQRATDDFSVVNTYWFSGGAVRWASTSSSGSSVRSKGSNSSWMVRSWKSSTLWFVEVPINLPLPSAVSAAAMLDDGKNKEMHSCRLVLCFVPSYVNPWKWTKENPEILSSRSVQRPAVKNWDWISRGISKSNI